MHIQLCDPPGDLKRALIANRRTRRMVPKDTPTIAAPSEGTRPSEENTNPLAVAIPPAAPVPKEMALTGEPTPDPNRYADWALSQILEKAKRIDARGDDLYDPDGQFAEIMRRHNADAGIRLATAAQKFEDNVSGLVTRVSGVEATVEGLTRKLEELEKKFEKERQELWTEIRSLQPKEKK